MDNLKHGDEMRIERRVYRYEPKDLADLSALPVEELRALREKSAAREQRIFERLCESAGAWEEQAKDTMLIDLAIEYVKTRAIEHTGNQWQPDRYGNGQEISNAVYKMYYHYKDITRHDYEAQRNVVVGCRLTWELCTNSPVTQYNHVIAGQDRKRFTDKATMEKYLQGRIKTYSHLFTELSPPIPKQFESYFKVNGRLLPGYTVEGRDTVQPERAADQQKGGVSVSEKRPSAMDKLAAAKEAVEKTAASKPEAPKEKPRGPEL